VDVVAVVALEVLSEMGSLVGEVLMMGIVTESVVVVVVLAA
jgi:hypothetical protein